MKSTDIYLLLLAVAFCIVGFKLYQSNTSFEYYMLESNKVRNIYECLNAQCFKREFQHKGELNSKKLLAIIPEQGCYECKESFEIELMDTLKNISGYEFIKRVDINLEDVMLSNYIQFEHVTLIVLDRYKTHYIYEYHPSFPLKKAKTEALLTFLKGSSVKNNGIAK